MVVRTDHIVTLYILCSIFFYYSIQGNFTMVFDKATSTFLPSFTNGRYIE